MTNGNRIRYRNDRELAKVLMCPMDMGIEMDCLYGQNGEKCEECIEKWLGEEEKINVKNS